jgi:polyhydroxybutyrate depolymerase
MRVLPLCVWVAACSFSTEPIANAPASAGSGDLPGVDPGGTRGGTESTMDPIVGTAGQAGATSASAGTGGSAPDAGGERGTGDGDQVVDAGQPVAAGSGGAKTSSGGEGIGGDSAIDASDPDAGQPPPVACAPGRLAAGEHLERTLAQPPGTRVFDMHVPASGGDQPAPVLYVLHPIAADESWNRASFVAKSEREGFIAVFPRAVNGVWGFGSCCGAGGAASADDVAFLRALHAEIATLACVDARRVYATGMSAGGSLAQRLGCEAADLFVAVATVGSVLGIPATQCRPSQPVALLQIHGTADTQVPYAGSPFTVSAQLNAELWAERNGCSADAAESFRAGAASCMTYAPCSAQVEVTLCSIDGGGSCWFGDPPCYGAGNSTLLPATDTAWAFLERFSR